MQTKGVDRQKKIAVRLRITLTKLGVTFIKLGQFLSIRRDIVPLEIADELALLQDQVPAIPFTEAKAIIERELNCPLENCFFSFEAQPIASASIGQVHKAVLKNGNAVAIKVQRNNLDFVVKQDLALLYFLIRWIKFLRPGSDWQNWTQLIDEFGNMLFAEMDYLQEGRNADRLRATLRYFPAVIIPRVFWLYTTKRIITEELCLGVKIDKLSLLTNVDLKRLAQNIVRAYLAQIIDTNYFHADPHAGNLAVNAHGQLIIYDFGMMGYITDKQKQGLSELISSIAKNDISLFLHSLSHLGFIDAHRSTDKNLQKIIEKIWTNFHLPGKKEMDLVQLEKEMDLLLLKRYFRLPANLAYLIRMVMALEAIVYRLDPELNFLKMANPYFKKILIS